MFTKVVAHELGHQLGILHDYREINGTKSGGRFAMKTGNECTNIHGIMDFDSARIRWSECSAEDLERYYQEVVAKYGKFCMEQLRGQTSCRLR